jgi:hypothetical protein
MKPPLTIRLFRRVGDKKGRHKPFYKELVQEVFITNDPKYNEDVGIVHTKLNFENDKYIWKTSRLTVEYSSSPSSYSGSILEWTFSSVSPDIFHHAPVELKRIQRDTQFRISEIDQHIQRLLEEKELLQKVSIMIPERLDFWFILENLPEPLTWIVFSFLGSSK